MPESKAITAAQKRQQKMLGDLLRRRRMDLSITQKEVTHHMGLEYLANISSYERGARIPLKRVPALADILRLDPKLLGRAMLAIYEPELHKSMFGATTAEQEIRNVDPNTELRE